MHDKGGGKQTCDEAASPPLTRTWTTFSKRLLRFCRLFLSAVRLLRRFESSSICFFSSSDSACIENTMLKHDALSELSGLFRHFNKSTTVQRTLGTFFLSLYLLCARLDFSCSAFFFFIALSARKHTTRNPSY